MTNSVPVKLQTITTFNGKSAVEIDNIKILREAKKHTLANFKEMFTECKVNAFTPTNNYE